MSNTAEKEQSARLSEAIDICDPRRMRHPEHQAALPLALTMGDPAGIGPDITVLAWHERTASRLFPFFVVGDPEVYVSRAAALGLKIATATLLPASIGETRDIFTDALPVLPVPMGRPAVPGKPDRENAAAIVGSVRQAVRLVHQGKALAVVTNPINKLVLYKSGFEYPGHTEFLGALAREHGGYAEPVMMLACEQIRAVPATVHIPLRDVPASLTKGLIVGTARITAEALANRFRIPSPRIAITGLNPHAGEGGSLGTEERDIIAPAIQELRQSGFDATGPWPADTIFQERLRSSYDAVVTMYHDQALVAVKTLAFDTAVNVTLGLPFVRTSPDHGTAYDLAGTGKANASSLVEALKLAAKLGCQQKADA